MAKIITGSDPEKYFEILGERLGKGAYGTVVKARSRKNGMEIAIKIMDIQKDDHASLKEELAILAACNSPHTVAYVASFIKGDEFWIAMEYCSAGSVMDLIGICRITLTESEIAVCMSHALQGLEYLHKKKIIHR